MATLRQAVPGDVPEQQASAVPEPAAIAVQGDGKRPVQSEARPAIPSAASIKGPPPIPIDQRIDALLKLVRANRPNEDVSLIRKAWEFCVRQHEGQVRASGEPYIIHPLEVAEVLAEM